MKATRQLLLEQFVSWVIAAILFTAMCLVMLGCEQAIQPKRQTTILAFTAEWCAACKRDAPCLAANRLAGIDVIQVDVDERPDLVKRYDIRGIPAYVVLLPDGSAMTAMGSCEAVRIARENQ